ncbi:MAG: hypothetical protein AAGJ11_06440, partial [Bacteroidota bacterium]
DGDGGGAVPALDAAEVIGGLGDEVVVAEVHGGADQVLLSIRTPGLRNGIITSVAFVATKLEAFQSETRRNAGDVLASHDLEDVVTVLDGRPSFEDELGHAPTTVREYLARAFAELLADDDFIGALEGHVSPGPTRTERARLLLARLRRISRIAGAS